MGKFFLEEEDFKSCLNKFYECQEIRAKLLKKSNPALKRINILIEETENFIRNTNETVPIENIVVKKTDEASNRSFDIKEKNFDSTSIDSNTNYYKSNLTIYSSKNEPEKAKENAKKMPKFIDFRGFLLKKFNFRKSEFKKK